MKVERRLAYTSSQFMADAIVCTVDANGNPDTPDSREAFKAGGQELEKCSSTLPEKMEYYGHILSSIFLI